MYESSGFVAITTSVPSASTVSSNDAHAAKDSAESSRLAGEGTVNRGNGKRCAPSSDGGVRHTPPCPQAVSTAPSQSTQRGRTEGFCSVEDTM